MGGRYHDNGYEGIFLELQQDQNKLLLRQTEAIENMVTALKDLGNNAAWAGAMLQQVIDSTTRDEEEYDGD